MPAKTITNVTPIMVIIVAVLAPRIAQPLSYHDFADRRAWLGVPNLGDVVSNAGFAIAGIWGLMVLLEKPARVQFVDPRERWPYEHYDASSLRKHA